MKMKKLGDSPYKKKKNVKKTSQNLKNLKIQ